MNTAVITTDNYFLSASNPAATADQRECEAMALKVFEMPVVLRAREQAAMRWKNFMSRFVTNNDWFGFDNYVEEWCFSFVMKAVASDSNYPRIMGQLFSAPHEWMGNKVPGSRAGGADNPDNDYIVMPIDGYAHYELSGRRFDSAPGDCPMVVTADMSLLTTISILDWQDLKFHADGTFVVTIGPESAEGRVNHLRTTLDARYIFMRQCKSNWRQTQLALRIKRLSPPAAPPMTMDQYADRAALFMLSEILEGQAFMTTLQAIPANTVLPPFNTAAIGGLVTQMMALGRAKVADDEAFVVTASTGNAAYHALTLGHPMWMISLDCVNRSGHANIGQTVPNDDGSTTYIIAKSDPGVANWLDTGGLGEVTMIHRWQGLPKGGATPTIEGKLVKLNALDAALPSNTRRLSVADRKQQLVERLATFKMRYADQ